MSKASRIPDEVWESHKETIRDLYQRKELKDLIRIMKESYQFQATGKQYIRRLGKWKIKKYSTSEQWQRAGQLVSMRHLNGKESELRMNHKPISKSKFRKELSRRAGPTLQPIQIGGPRSETPDSVEVYTPPAMIAEASNHIRIPWFDFDNLIEAMLTPINSIISDTYARRSSYHGQIIDLEHGLPSDIPNAEAYTQSASYNYSHPIASADVLEMGPVSWDPNDPNLTRGDVTTQSAHNFNREACSVLAHLLGIEVEPDSDEYIVEIRSNLKAILIETDKGDLTCNVAGFLNSSPWDAASQLLRYSIYLSSNNLILGTRMDKLLAWITRHKQFNAIKTLTSLKTPTTDTFAAYLLVSAARLQDLDTVRDLIALGVDVNVPVGHGSQQTALYEATHSKNIALVQILIRAGANPKVFNGWINAPIIAAITATEKDLVVILLRARTDINSSSYRTTYDELCSAIEQRSPELIRILLASSGPMDKFGAEGSALQFAAESNNLEIVQILLNAGCDANAMISEDHMLCLYPIQHAASNNNIEMVQILLDSGARVDEHYNIEHYDVHFDDHTCEIDCTDGSSTFTALQYAVKNKNMVMARTLLKAGAEVNKLKDGGTPLQIAVDKRDRDMVELLSGFGANINDPAWQCFGRTALQSAIENPHHELTDFLIEKGANINGPAAAHYGRAVIQAAVESGDVTLVEKLVALGADINAPPSTVGGRTCLQLAAAMGNAEMVQKLLQFGSDINAPITTDKDNGQTPLLEALQGNHMEVFNLLLDAHTKARMMSSVLQVFTSSGNLEMVRECLENTLHNKDDLSSGLLTAVKSERSEIVRYILDAGAEVNYHTSFSPTAIHEAVSSENIDIVCMLIDAGADLTMAFQTDFIGCGNVVRPLTIAAYRQNLELVQLLLSKGASANDAIDCDHSEITALDAAIMPQWRISGLLEPKKKILQALLEAGADINRERRGHGTPLNIMVEHYKPDLVSLCLEWGADVNKIDTKGVTALQAAARRNRTEVMEALIQAGAGASINSPASNDSKYRRSAFQFAAERGNQTAVKLLLQHGADCNAAAAPDGGLTALQAAAIKGNLPITVLLLKEGAKINAPAARKNGRTALEGAAEYGHLEIVLLLLENDAERDGLEVRCKKAAAYAENKFPIIARFLRSIKLFDLS